MIDQDNKKQPKDTILDKEQAETQNTESSSNLDQETPEPNLDPTHFGDWQIGCKTIDF